VASNQVIYQLCESGVAEGIESQDWDLEQERRTRRSYAGEINRVTGPTEYPIASTRPFLFLRVPSLPRELGRAEADYRQITHFPWPSMTWYIFAQPRWKKPQWSPIIRDIVRQQQLLKLYSPLDAPAFWAVLIVSSRAFPPTYLVPARCLAHACRQTRVIP